MLWHPLFYCKTHSVLLIQVCIKTPILLFCIISQGPPFLLLFYINPIPLFPFGSLSTLSSHSLNILFF